MTSLLERARARALEAKKKEKPRMRVMAITNMPAPEEPQSKRLPQDRGEHVVGGKCPHCTGGKYFNHTKRLWAKCFRCDGKGALSASDLLFYNHRRSNGLALSQVYGGLD